jgi:hypothetical protein
VFARWQPFVIAVIYSRRKLAGHWQPFVIVAAVRELWCHEKESHFTVTRMSNSVG